MKLIKIEAHGFKSFADPITLNLDGGVAGIVGPNGSGKSNINDAIKWVLGERSAKELRGDNMDDVIFAGSKTAKPLNKAVVTLTFDNKNANNNIPHEKVTISRVLERGNGNNQYFLNGEPCRQKDIKDIAMETGIGKSSLAIISQGTVSDIAEATPEDRKAIFEEAAGVSKYKFRKKEALSKLARTEEGLEQVRLVISEIERKLNPLRKQAEKAKVYIEKNNELKAVELGLLVNNIEFYGKIEQDLIEELDGVSETRKDLENRIHEAEIKISQNSTYKVDLEKEIRMLSDQYELLKSRIANLDILIARNTERQRLIASGQMMATNAEKISTLKELLNSTAAKISFYDQEIKNVNNRISENNKTIEQYTNEINALNISLNKNKSDLFKLETRYSIMKEQKENNTLFFKGTKTILENKSFFKGLKGTVADLIKVNPEYIAAIDAVLSNATQHLVVDNAETAVKAVNFLKENDGGRATFVPLTSIQPKLIRDDYVLAIQSHPGFVAIANELVSVKPEFEILNKFLLGNVVVASDISSANKISAVLERKYMVVTTDGDIVRAGGVMVGGAKNTNQSLLGFEETMKKIQDLIPGIEAKISSVQTKLNEISNFRREGYELDSQLKNEIANINSTKINLQREFDDYTLQIKEISNSKEDLKLSIENAPQTELDRQVLESKMNAILSTLRAKTERLSAINSEINSTITLKSDYEKTLRNLINAYANKIGEKEKASILLEQSRERLAKHYKMTYEIAAQQAKLEMNRDQAQEIVDQLRSEIDALGHVNLESLEMLEEEEKRFKEFSDSEAELSAAKATLESAIADMDKIIVTRLTNIIHDVNEEFNNVFKTMFGGGQAKLLFTDPKNILDSGVDIEAQPPGKNIKNLKLFSGGEKSLIAISLLFGILKARPLPLCILDEVEAALDESNVVRYAEYLQALKEKTQFLVITHRHGTMSRVDNLFGATMQNRGVTSFFSVKLSEAKKLVDDFQKQENASKE
ncbi:AAA family ATPase [Mycoplasmopsis hyopharyngis]|uniref:AAA family ATPase n=1 Tax=Mycoplasmopsis hyopharyngis TaxID=29558 RepID=UPI003872C4CF